MGVFSWVVVVGGRGRPGAVVAGIAALGILLVEPLGRRIPKSTVAEGARKRQPRPVDKWLAVIAVGALAQLALGAFLATVAGREKDPILALLMVAPALVLIGAAAPYLLPTATQARRSKRGSSRRRHRYATSRG
jgi:hypothetical protein